MRMTGFRGWCASLVTVHGLIIITGILLTFFTPSTSSPLAQRDRMRLMSTLSEPPRRPSSFASVDELNNYLEELRQYYTLLGRPRFGRSVRIQSDDVRSSNKKEQSIRSLQIS